MWESLTETSGGLTKFYKSLFDRYISHLYQNSFDIFLIGNYHAKIEPDSLSLRVLKATALT